MADLVLLNKADLVSPTELAQLRSSLGSRTRVFITKRDSNLRQALELSLQDCLVA